MALKDFARRLQEAQIDELLSLLREQEAATLLAHPKVGQGWRNFIVDRIAQLREALEAAEARLQGLEEEVRRLKEALEAAEAPLPSSVLVTETEAPRIGETTEVAVPSEVVEVQLAEAVEAEAETVETAPPVEETAEKTAEPTEATAPTEAQPAEVTAEKEASARSIVTLAQRAIRAREEFSVRMQEAYKALTGALTKKKLRIRRDAEYVKQGVVQKAVTWLQTRIAKGEMTVEEAVEMAKKEGWTEEFSVSPTVYQAMTEAFRKANLYLFHTVVDGETAVDLPTELAKAIEAGEVSVEEAVELAKKAGWARPYQHGTLEEILGPEKVQELREGGPKSKGKRR